MPKPFDLNKVASHLRTFVQMVDTLLQIRQRDASLFQQHEYTPKWETVESREVKKWNLTELQLAIPSFLDIRRGKIKGVPDRKLVNDLANWLECTLKERNDLLLSLGYAPEDPFLEGEEYEKALFAARRVMNYIPMPAYVLTRDWTIRDWNDNVLTFLGWTNEIALSVPAEQLNVLHLIFNPELGLRPRMDIRTGVWEQTAWRNIYGFINQNFLCRYDPWFIDLVKQLHQLPDFPRFWNIVTRDGVPPYFRYTHIDYTTEIMAPNGKLVRFHSLFICNGDLYYPQVAAFIPADDASRKVFEELGLPVPENWWGYKV